MLGSLILPLLFEEEVDDHLQGVLHRVRPRVLGRDEAKAPMIFIPDADGSGRPVCRDRA